MHSSGQSLIILILRVYSFERKDTLIYLRLVIKYMFNLLKELSGRNHASSMIGQRAVPIVLT
jgi:hypothetical protein